MAHPGRVIKMAVFNVGVISKVADVILLFHFFSFCVAWIYAINLCLDLHMPLFNTLFYTDPPQQVFQLIGWWPRTFDLLDFFAMIPTPSC